MFKSAAEAPAGDALEQAWRDVLTGKPWITAQVFEAAVYETLQTTGAYLPTVGQFVEVCALVKRELDQATEPRALPPPPRREVEAGDAVDPSDPYSCTAEERERWAREDAHIRKWAATLPPPTPPDVLARLSYEDREATLDFERRNASVANWPNLRPADRRAKEQRIAAERDAALAQLGRVFGRAAAALGAGANVVPARPRPLTDAEVAAAYARRGLTQLEPAP